MEKKIAVIMGYHDRYEAESNFEATTKNFEAYTEDKS